MSQAFSGAASGASAGAAFGPWGAVIGGALGALGGLGADKDAKKADRLRRLAIKARFSEDYRALSMERSQLVGDQRTRYAASGVLTDVGTPQLIVEESEREFARTAAAMQSNKKLQLQSGQPAGDSFWQSGLSAFQTAGSIYGAGQASGWGNPFKKG